MIRGLTSKTINNFRGKNTTAPLESMEPGDLLSAKNVVVLGDGQVRTRNGYTQVKAFSGKIQRQYYFQRDSDQTKWVLLHRGSNLSAMKVDGSSDTVLKSAESTSSQFDFINTYFEAFCSDGNNSYRIDDIAGTMTAYQWGITAPTVAPTIANGVGSLTLASGRAYCYCYVSYFTDSRGTQRMSISAPSPLSAHTGPLTSKVITVGAMTASMDAQVTHIWVFTTMDSPFNAGSTLYFLAEITNGTTSYGDSTSDDDLDTTRLAPFDNNPAPHGAIVGQFQNRALVINGNIVYASGFEEIDLGIPQHAFPSQLFFTLPEAVAAQRVIDEGQTLMLATSQAWYRVRGYNAQTLSKRDRVLTPGCAGKKLCVVTPTHMVWGAPDKRLYAWSFGGAPIDISAMVAKSLTGTLAMENITDAQWANSELKWFSFGSHNFLVLGTNTTTATTGFDWLALFYVDMKAGQIQGVYQTDFLPTDYIASMEVVTTATNEKYLYLGDNSTGAIYRWPDGFQDNGVNFVPSFSPAFVGDEVTKRYFWIDVRGTRQDMPTQTRMAAAVGDSPNIAITPRGLTVQALPSNNQDGAVCRANMQQAGTAIGKFVRPVVMLPNDGSESVITAVVVNSAPLYQSAP
jgi:hypothetical protein